jgi:signal peptidase I
MDERADKYFDDLVSQAAIDRDKDFTISADELDALSQIPHVESSGGIDATEYMTTRTQPDEATMNVVLKPFATHENTSFPSEDESNSILKEMEESIMDLQGVDDTPFIDASEYSVSGSDANDTDEDFEIGFSFDASDTIPFEDDGKFIPLEVVTPYSAPRKDPSFDNDDGAVIPDEELDLPPYATAENTSYRPEEPAVAASVTGREVPDEEVKEEPSLTNRSKKKSSKTKAKPKKPRTTMHGKKTVTGPEPNENQDSSEASAGVSKESARLEENVRPVEEEKPQEAQIAPDELKIDVTPDLDVSADTSSLDPEAVVAQAPVEESVSEANPEADAGTPFSIPFEMPENLFANQNTAFTESPADFMGHADYENDMDFSDLRGGETEGTSSIYADVNDYASTDNDSEFTLPLDAQPAKRKRSSKSKKAASEDDSLEAVIANALNNMSNAEGTENTAARKRRKLAVSPEEEEAANVTSTDDVANAISAFFAREDAKTGSKTETPEAAKPAGETSATAAEDPSVAKSAAPAAEENPPVVRPVRRKRPPVDVVLPDDGVTAPAADETRPTRRKRPAAAKTSEDTASAQAAPSGAEGPVSQAEEEAKPAASKAQTEQTTAKRAGSGTRRVTRRQVEGPVLETGSDTVEVINVDVDDDILENEDIEDSLEFRNTVEADPHAVRDLSDASQKRPEEQTSYAQEIAAMAAQKNARQRAAVAEAARKEEQRSTEHMGPVRTSYGSTPDPADAMPSPDRQRPMTASQRIAAKRPSLADPIAFDPKLDQDPFEYKFEKKNKGSKLKGLLKDFLLVIVLPVVIALLLVKFVIISAVVPSESMQPTVNVGDRLFGFRLAYIFSSPKRGDVIIFEYPDDPKRLFIKRIIGLPGETIRIADNAVYITPKGGSEYKLDEPYLPKGILMETPQELKFTIPADHYFVMGDNRNNSHDSRFWDNHFVSRDAIKAKAGLIFWPFSNFGFIK